VGIEPAGTSGGPVTGNFESGPVHLLEQEDEVRDGNSVREAALTNLGHQPGDVTAPHMGVPGDYEERIQRRLSGGNLLDHHRSDSGAPVVENRMVEGVRRRRPDYGSRVGHGHGRAAVGYGTDGVGIEGAAAGGQ
jgi:hypothetical protein